jgi:hypothetical protein
MAEETPFEHESYVFIDREKLDPETQRRLDYVANSALLLAETIGKDRLQRALGNEYRLNHFPPGPSGKEKLGEIAIKDKGGFYKIHGGKRKSRGIETENHLLLKTGAGVMRVPVNTEEEDAADYITRARKSEKFQLEAAQSWLRQTEERFNDIITNLHAHLNS